MPEVASTSVPLRRRRMAVSTALFAAATGVSRIVGLAREVVAAYVFGIHNLAVNQFESAFAVPNVVRALVADAALGAAFVPVFNELLEKDERERAWRVASTVFWLAAIGLSAITATFMVFAPQVMGLFRYHGELAVNLARILFPIVVLLGLNGIQIAILNTFDEFFVPAIAPVAWNAVILGVLLGAMPFYHSLDDRIYAYTIGILAGTVVQFALPLPWLRNRGGRIGLRLDVRDPAVGRVFLLMLPVTLAIGLINVNVLVDTFFATRVDKSLAPAAITKAFRIYMLPQGMVSVAVAAVVFPAMSRAAATADTAALRRLIATGLRQIAFLLIPASAICAVLAEPIVRLLYQRGEFTPHQTIVVAHALQAFALGLAFNGAMLLLNRAFFSLQMPWLPTWVAVVNLIANGLLDLVLYRPFGIWGIPLATSLVNLIGVAALVIVLRRRTGGLEEAAIASVFARILVASAILAGVGYGVWRLLDEAVGRSLGGQVVSLGVALTASGVAYVAAAHLMGVEELRAIASLRRRAA